MQNRPKILIVLPETDVEKIKKHISDEAITSAHSIVSVIGLRTSLPASEKRNASQKNTNAIAAMLAENDFTQVFLHGNLPIDSNDLKHDYEENTHIRSTNSLTTLYKEISTVLKLLGLHWLIHANKEWEKSSIKSISPEAWVEQFARLGEKEIAKRLLKSLRVIEDTTLRNSFSNRKEEMLGLRVGHGFFFDEEKGSSSIVVQQVLEHMYPGKVYKLKTEDATTWADLDIDRLYVYEDGLWSGVELVRRLEAIVESQHFKNSDLHFYFKFSATSDIGLAAARFYTRKIKSSRFHFIPGEVGNHFEFFRRDADISSFVISSEGKVQRDFLDGLVEPYAFKNPDIWADGRDQAISLCEQVGDQLIIPFLARKSNKSPSEISMDECKRWRLGAMNFASTVVFSSSIPKPVLPLMWLQGEVAINGRQVDWRPLFWDVRRTGVYEKAHLE